RVAAPDVRLGPRADGPVRNLLVGTGAGRLPVRLLLSGTGVRPGAPGLEIRMLNHPLMNLFEDEGIAARGVAREVLLLGVLLAPEDAQPGRHGDLVVRLLRPEELEFLVRGDAPAERA